LGAEGRISVALLLLAIAQVAWPDWRRPDPANLLYVQLPHGEVILELASGLAPKNVANIKVLTREKYFDGLAIVRSQDNYVAQWADPAEEPGQARSLGSAAAAVPPEFQRTANEVEISTIESRDAYADIVGFVEGFPAGSDGKHVWLAHCYGMVGVARGNAPDSGNGSSLYVVTGHAPRHLDRNITLVGRVISGIEYLAILPRGSAALGFYESADETTPILSVRLGTEVPEKERIQIEIMRTDSAEFSDYVKSRTTRTEEWFVEPTGRIEICNIHPPKRIAH
jgi:cyclophilin family peptidyl-prolyl cis-trans isomerase